MIQYFIFLLNNAFLNKKSEICKENGGNKCVLYHEHLFKPSGCKPLAWLNLWAQGAYEQPAGSTSYAEEREGKNKKSFPSKNSALVNQMPFVWTYIKTVTVSNTSSPKSVY